MNKISLFTGLIVFITLTVTIPTEAAKITVLIDGEFRELSFSPGGDQQLNMLFEQFRAVRPDLAGEALNQAFAVYVQDIISQRPMLRELGNPRDVHYETGPSEQTILYRGSVFSSQSVTSIGGCGEKLGDMTHEDQRPDVLRRGP